MCVCVLVASIYVWHRSADRFSPTAIYEQLSENIARVGGAECAGNLFEAFVQISTLMERRQSARLSNAFNTCFDIAYYNQFDVAAFFAGITQILVDYINVNQ